MKRIASFLIALTCVLTAVAVPAKRVERSVTLQDGTQVVATLMGDEYAHYYLTTDGRVLTEQADGTFTVSDQSEQQLRQAGMRRAARRNESRMKRTVGIDRNLAPRGMAILVNFKNNSFKVSSPKQAFSNMLNQEGYSVNDATGSCRDYFKSASMGKYAPEFDVYGPYTLSNNMAYYGRDNGGEGEDENPVEMIVEACRMAVADGADFSRYDNNNDGIIDFVYVFYAGYSQAEGAPANTIWPHSWEVCDSASYPGYDEDGYLNYNYEGTAADITFNGKKLYTYACSSELSGTSGTNMEGIGTFTHEFSHVLGLPDLYATNSASHKTMGEWDILDYGPYNNEGRTPPTYSAYERFFMGWMTPELLNSAQECRLEHIATSNRAYMITSSGRHNMDGVRPDPDTYYLLENRQQTGWDAYIPGHGLLVTKISFDSAKWVNNTVNNTASSMGVDIIEADGKATSRDYYGKQGDLFPTSSRTSFVPYSQYPVTEIAENGSVISFGFMQGQVNPNPNPNPNPGGNEDCFYESFNEVEIENNNTGEDISDLLDWLTDNEGWTTSTEKVFAADGEVRLGSSKKAGKLTTPELGITGQATLTFMARKYADKDGATLTLTADGGASVSPASVSMTSENQTFTVSLTGCTPSTTITFAPAKRCYLDEVQVCPVGASAVEEVVPQASVTAHEGVLTVSSLNGNMQVRVYNLTGQLMASGTAAPGWSTNLPRGFYVVQAGSQALKIIID